MRGGNGFEVKGIKE
uniref:Uncharacterized protein n=1 Tax=Arundo donax TaxID=35708 RepID=A0A0A9FG85_ARUDO